MHNLYTFEHRLSWFYTCVNRQGKEKPKKTVRARNAGERSLGVVKK